MQLVHIAMMSVVEADDLMKKKQDDHEIIEMNGHDWEPLTRCFVRVTTGRC